VASFLVATLIVVDSLSKNKVQHFYYIHNFSIHFYEKKKMKGRPRITTFQKKKKKEKEKERP
jgi:hypothetical protein